MVSLRRWSDPWRVIRFFFARTGVASTNMLVALVMRRMIADTQPEKCENTTCGEIPNWVLGRS